MMEKHFGGAFKTKVFCFGIIFPYNWNMSVCMYYHYYCVNKDVQKCEYHRSTKKNRNFDNVKDTATFIFKSYSIRLLHTSSNENKNLCSIKYRIVEINNNEMNLSTCID